MNFDKYNVTIPFPEKPWKPRVKPNPTIAALRKYADDLEQYEKEMVVYREAAQAYYAAQAQMRLQFKADVLQEHGLTGHPKADKVYDMAWQEGHADGYGNIERWVEDLAELVLD